MKIFIKIYFVLIVSSIFKVNACDVCGSSLGGSYLGILPQFQKNYLGVQYAHREFLTDHTSIGSKEKTLSYEVYRTIEARGRFFLSSKVQLFIFLPFNVNQQTENNLTTHITGIGDFTLLTNVLLYNSKDSNNSKWKHNFQIGGGLKFPIGKYNVLDKNNVLNPNTQNGTGSFDILFDLIYTIRVKKIGLNSNAIYRLNTTNKNQYKFGNILSLNTNLFYWAKIKTTSLLPSVGILFENMGNDVHKDIPLGMSGGNTLLINVGIDFYIKRIVIGSSYQIPTYRDNANIANSTRFNTKILYNF